MNLGVVTLLQMLVWMVLFPVPFFFILPKAGFSRWWLLFFVLPFFGGIILLWIVALRRWKNEVSAEVFA